MAINLDKARIESAKANLISWLTDNGVEVFADARLDDLVALLSDIEVGGGEASAAYKELIEKGQDITTIDFLPNDLSTIGPGFFEWCSSLRTLPPLPSSLTSIGNNAFYKCSNLLEISLPEGLTTIGNNAFYSCESLALTSLPEGLTTIGNYAFSYCTGIKELTFHGTPKILSSSAFTGLTNLLTINVPWSEGAVSGAPWGATKATINYDYVG